MQTEALDFLTLLLKHTPQQEGYLTLTAIHPTDEHKPRPSRHIPLGSLFQQRLQPALDDLIEANHSGWGAYFAVALRDHDLGRWHRGGKANLFHLPALFVDIDVAPDIALPRLQRLPPASIVLSSGRGAHAYWLLGEPADLDRCDQAIKAMNKLVGGDPALNNASSMRLVGSMNSKYPTQPRCTILRMTDDLVYPISAFPSTTYESHAAPRITHKNRINPAVTQAVLDRLYRDYAAFQSSPSSRWHKALCPCGHQNDAPGRHFYFDQTSSAANCFGRHGGFTLKSLCEILNVPYRDLGGLFIE